MNSKMESFVHVIYIYVVASQHVSESLSFIHSKTNILVQVVI